MMTAESPYLPDLDFRLNPQESVRVAEAAKELAKRKRSALNLFEELPHQKPFFESRATERILRGGNRSGKSLCGYLETARAALGQDSHGKFPTDRALRIWLICYDIKQVGRTAYRMLFTSDNTFKIIRDPKTRLWRAFRPWQPWDAEHAKEAIPAPPLIPERYAPDEAFDWHKKGPKIFDSVRLRFPAGHPMDGTTIHAFASGARPPQGDPVDVIHIDEDLKYPEHIAELQARLSDTGGRLHWTVWPHTANDALRDMSHRAAADAAKSEKPDVTETVISFSDNPYISEEQKRIRLKGWTDQEARSRDRGEFLFDTILVYPRFNIEVHGIPKLTEPGVIDEMITSGGDIPRDWTRYMIVDPGVSVTAVLFAAVPPPERFGEVAVCYDELYLRQCNARIFAENVVKHMGDVSFRAFIIDDHGSRVRDAGTGLSIRKQYSQELALRSIRSETTGSGFLRGSDDIAGRIMEVQRWLSPRENGTTRFRIIKSRLPNMEDEFLKYKKKISRDEIQDKPVAANNHLLDCLGYFAAYNPQHYPPQVGERPLSPGYRAHLDWKDRRCKRIGSSDTIRCGIGKGLLTHTFTTMQDTF